MSSTITELGCVLSRLVASECQGNFQMLEGLLLLRCIHFPLPLCPHHRSVATQDMLTSLRAWLLRNRQEHWSRKPCSPNYWEEVRGKDLTSLGLVLNCKTEFRTRVKMAEHSLNQLQNIPERWCDCTVIEWIIFRSLREQRIQCTLGSHLKTVETNKVE